jgi:RimJ/RimL family protein N-acetyltransferase
MIRAEMASELVFSLVGDDETAPLAEWLAAETWPFHSRPRLTPEDARGEIRAGGFTGSNPTYWVDLTGAGRVGIVRYRYLDDVSPDVDVRLVERHRGQGLGGLMLEWAADHLFTTTDKHRLAGETRVDNVAMCRVFERCGWVREAHYRQSWPTEDGGWADSVGYAILRDDWQRRREC